jgi:hypothetical protein
MRRRVVAYGSGLVDRGTPESDTGIPEGSGVVKVLF